MARTRAQQPAGDRHRMTSPGTTSDRFAPDVAQCTFPPSGTEITCAVSGGADSSALLILATAAGCRVTAIHVDHGLRPTAALDAAHVAGLAEQFGAEFVSVSVTVAPGPNLEERAREARYSVLPHDVLTGHTADDQAETMLLNLVRGAGIDGMAGMRPDGRRPLLGLRRSDTRRICEQAGVDPRHDETNDDSRFRRNRIRHEVLPLLNAISERDVVPILARQAALFSEDADALDGFAWELDPTDAKALAQAAPAIARRSIRALLRGEGRGHHPPDHGTVERVLDVARGKAVGTEVGGGWHVRRSQQRLNLVGPV